VRNRIVRALAEAVIVVLIINRLENNYRLAKFVKTESNEVFTSKI
jgi:hypothetical protein